MNILMTNNNCYTYSEEKTKGASVFGWEYITPIIYTHVTKCIVF